MRCPYCKVDKDRVIDSREVRQGSCIRRRRECMACHRRFTTYEKVEETPLMVVKMDGRREAFSSDKLRHGILQACSKRPISMESVEEILEHIETHVNGLGKREIPSNVIGEQVMTHLKELDQVAYVRFASVYSRFENIGEFLNEIRHLLDNKEDPTP